MECLARAERDIIEMQLSFPKISFEQRFRSEELLTRRSGGRRDSTVDRCPDPAIQKDSPRQEEHDKNPGAGGDFDRRHPYCCAAIWN